VHGNGVGGAGLGQGHPHLPVRALDADGGGYDNDVARASSWAVDNGAKVVNLSLGGPQSSTLLTSAINYALGRGVVVVAAAATPAPRATPCCTRPRPPASSLSPPSAGTTCVPLVEQRRHIALAARASGILSSVPGGGYAGWDGTSMAAPFVAAAAR
jgi:subtilisin family serine protease